MARLCKNRDRMGGERSSADVAAVVDACCRFARDYRRAGGTSRKALLRATGYVDARRHITPAAIAGCLRANLEYLDDWAAMRADDEATSGLALWPPEEWNGDDADEEESPRWVVTNSDRTLFASEDRIAAEAHFIAAFLDQARVDTSEWRMVWGCGALFAIAIAALTIYISVAVGLSSALSWFLSLIP